MKKTETRSSEVASITEALFFAYVDDLIRNKLDFLGSFNRLFANAKGYVPLSMIDVRRVEYMAFEQLLFQSTEYYEELLRTPGLKVLGYYHDQPDYAAADVVTSICLYVLNEEKWIQDLYRELIDDPFVRLFFKKHAELGGQFYQEIECGDGCLASIKSRLNNLQIQLDEEKQNATISARVYRDLTLSLGKILRALRDNSVPPVAEHEKSKVGQKGDPENLLREVKNYVKIKHDAEKVEEKKDSIYPESREDMDMAQKEDPLATKNSCSERKDQNCQIHVVKINEGKSAVRI
ncbi:MAG: hypothetical protein ACFN3A_03115 [Candidatus Nanosyncoccus sp.]